jgi:hypothetical protein
MSDRIAAILANPEAHGFKFVLGTVHKGPKAWPAQPLITITDVAKFDATFPGRLLEYGNANVRVRTQEPARSDAPHDEIKRAQVAMLLGERVSGPALKYVAEDGQRFATAEECRAHAAKLAQAAAERMAAEMLKAQRGK